MSKNAITLKGINSPNSPKKKRSYIIRVISVITTLLALYLFSTQGSASSPNAPPREPERIDSTTDLYGTSISLNSQQEATRREDFPRFWDSNPGSGEVVTFNGQQNVVPGPSDPVRLIVQLNEEPVSRYINRMSRSDGNFTSSSSEIIKHYQNQITKVQNEVLSQMASLGIDVRVNRKFNYVFNGFAISTEMENWSKVLTIPHVKAVYPDYEMHIALDDSVPLIGAPQVWELKDGNGNFVTGKGVRVAIIDTGIDYAHPDLGGCIGANCKVLGGYDFVNDDNNPMDDHGHGTHVAGIVAANGVVKGVAPDARLLAYKVCDAGGFCWNSNIIKALEMAANPDGNPATNDEAHVINMSLGGWGDPDDPINQAVDNTVDLGIVVVVAAGNFGPNYQTLGSPGLARQALTVAASDKSDQLASFSSRGPVTDYPDVLKPDITAPGVSINSTVPLSSELGSPTRYKELSGTSMATPHIAGSAALIKQIHPTWTPETIKANLMNSARDLGMGVYEQGAGRVRLDKASTTSLVATPGSVHFGHSLPGSSKSRQITVLNNGSSVANFTASISAVKWADGTATPLPQPAPINYASLDETNYSVSPGGSQLVNVNLDVPSNASEGYYTGIVTMDGAGTTIRIPFAFTLLSKVIVHILDEDGKEWFDTSGKSFILAVSVPDLNVIRDNAKGTAFDNPSKVPVTFYVPSGTYNIHGFGRSNIYGTPEPWIDGQRQKPLLLSTTVNITPNSNLDVYLDASKAHLFKLNANTFSGNQQLISEWGARFRYLDNEKEYNLSIALYRGSTSSYYIQSLPDQLDFYISDTPAKVSMFFYSKGTGYSPRHEHFIHYNSEKWYEGPEMAGGMLFENNADEVYLFEWRYPQVDGITPKNFAYSVNQVSQYRLKYDYPGVIVDPIGPGLNSGLKSFFTGVDCISYMPLAPNSCFGHLISAGMERKIFVRGAFSHMYTADNFDNGRFNRKEYFLRDWTKAYEFNPNEFQIDGWYLLPEPPKVEDISFGIGSLYPAATFDNNNKNIRLIHPLFGNSGMTMVWGGYWDDWFGRPKLTIYQDGIEIYSTWLNEMFDLVFPMLQYPVNGGNYKVVITANRGDQISFSNTLEAGFVLPSSDMNPPRVTSMEIPQRFSPHQPITVKVSITDDETEVSSVVMKYSTNKGANWTVLPLNQSGETYSGVVNPGNAESLSLDYKATDSYGNYLSFTTHAVSIKETPVTLNIKPSPEEIYLSSEPFTMNVSGSLKDINGQPLSEAALPIAIYLNDILAGYVRDIARLSDGTFQHGVIDFDWTFIPADFVNNPGPVSLKFIFDVGTFSRQEVTQMINVVKAPIPTPNQLSVFIPLVVR